MEKPQPLKPVHIALICAGAVAILFLGSIAIAVAVVQAEHASPAAGTTSDP